MHHFPVYFLYIPSFSEEVEEIIYTAKSDSKQNFHFMWTYYIFEKLIDSFRHIWPFKRQSHKMVKHSNNSSAVAGELSVFDHSVGLALKGLTVCIKTTRLEEGLRS